MDILDKWSKELIPDVIYHRLDSAGLGFGVDRGGGDVESLFNNPIEALDYILSFLEKYPAEKQAFIDAFDTGDEAFQQYVISSFPGISPYDEQEFTGFLKLKYSDMDIKITNHEGKWTRSEVAGDPRRLYVFTDNTDRDSGRSAIDRDSGYYKRYGDGVKDLRYPSTTAAVIRGLENAMPVSTQHWYHAGAKGETGRWNDSDLDEFREVISAEFGAIRQALLSGRYDEVVFPEGGLFGGAISQITQERVPALYAALKAEFDSFVRFTEALEQDVKENLTIEENEEGNAVSQRRRGIELDDWFAGLPMSAKIKVFDSESIDAIIPDIRAKGEEASSDLDLALDVISSNLSGNWQESLSTQEINYVLGDLFTSMPAMLKEALHDSFQRLYTNGQGQDAAAGTVMFGTLDNASDYDVIMVGIGKRDLKEVMELFPDGTDFVVDARRSGRNYHDWRLNEARLIPFLLDLGLEHVSRNASLSFNGNYQMDRTEEDVNVQEAIGKLVEAADAGHRIVVLYDDSSPYKGTAAIGLGQALTRAGLEVGYRNKFAEHIHTTSHQNVILGILNRSTLLGGRVEQIHFSADGKYILEDGVELQERHVEERRIRGKWNYGREFNVDGKPVQPVVTDMDYAANRAYLAQCTGDITFKFLIGEDAKKFASKRNYQSEKGYNSRKGHIVYVPVELGATELKDVSYARMKAAECFAQIDSFVKWKAAARNNFDPKKLVVTVFGPNETEYSLKRISRAASDRELMMLDLTENGLNNDFSLSDEDHPSNNRYNYNLLKGQTDLTEDSYEPTGITEDHWTAFLTNFFAAINEGLSAHQYDAEQQRTGLGPEISHYALKDEGDELLFNEAASRVHEGTDEDRLREFVDEFDTASYRRAPYRINTVVTDCTPGADKAALLAAQSLGLGFYPVLAKDLETLVNTSMQQDVLPSSIKMKEAQTVYAKTAMVTSQSDTYLRVPKGQVEAHLLNSFHLGLKERNEREVSIDKEALLQDSNLKEQLDVPGLTPRQVRVLEVLGYSNGDIRMMVDAAVNDGRRITSPREMLDFLLMCNEQFLLSESQSLPDEGRIIDALLTVDQETESLIREEGETFVAVNELSYPASLKAWAGFSRTITQIIPSQVVDTVEVVRDEQDGGVAHVEYDYLLTKEEVKKVKVDEHSPAVLHYKGDISVFDRPTIAVLGYEQEQAATQAAGVIGRALAHNDVVLVSSLSRGSNMAAVRAALDNGGRVALVSPNPLDNDLDRDLIDEVVRKGGCVVSEYPHRDNEKASARTFQDSAESRSNHMASVLGKYLLVLDNKVRDNQTVDIKEVTSIIKDAREGVGAIDYGDAGKETVRLRANSELIDEHGATPIKPDGEGLAPVIRKAQLLSTQWVEESAHTAEELRRSSVKNMSVKRERLRTVPLSVVRSGNMQVFVVHSSLDYVRDAVKDNYGDDVRFAESIDQAMDMLAGVPVKINGRIIDTFRGWEGTQPVVDLPYVSQLLLHDDIVYSVSNAPESAIGVPLPERLMHLEAINYFIEGARNLSKELNASVGLKGMPAMRFGEGKYLVIHPNGVDVYEGSGEAADSDRLLASVFLSSKGRLTVSVNDYDLHLDSVQKFNDVPFSKTGTIHIDFHKDPEDRLDAIRSAVDPLLKSLGNSLLSSSEEETEEYALASREEREEIDKTIESGYREVSSVNGDIIVRSIFNSLGNTIAMPANDEPVNRAKMLAKIGKSLVPYSDKLKELSDRKVKVEKEYVSAVHKLGTVSSSEENMHIQISDSVKELESAVSNLYSEIGKISAVIDHLQYEKYLIANAGNVFLADSPASDDIIGLYVDGRLINVKDIMVHAAEIEISKNELEALQAEAKSDRESFLAINSKVEGLVSAGRISDIRSKRDARIKTRMENKQALQEEIVAQTTRGQLYIIQREGLYAIAGRDLVIRSEFYPEMSVMGNSQRFLIKMNNGQYNVLNSLGNKLFTGGYDEIRPEVDHISAVRSDGKWNHVDFRRGGQEIAFWEAEVRDFSEGWAAFKGDENEVENEGKWNFVDRDGNLISDVWFDDVKDFKDGKAECLLGDEIIVLDKEGNEVERNEANESIENDFDID